MGLLCPSFKTTQRQGMRSSVVIQGYQGPSCCVTAVVIEFFEHPSVCLV
jgi:hypothetical protein